jgi:folate-binding protein YgfZ
MATRYCNLTDRLAIAVRGADAAAFLHGQLSQAVAELGAGHAPLAAWHDARGRVRALARVHRLPDRWLLVTPSDGANALVKKLGLFVLRAAVTLALADDVGIGAIVDATPEWLASRGLPTDAAPNRTVSSGELILTCVGGDLWQALGPRPALEAFAATVPSASPAEAAAAEIALGLPLVTAPLAERFVAQMLNLEQLGAIAFDKGCYPGQEIVARVHNLGGVKRRARRFAAAAAIAPGGEVLAGDAVVGEVIRTAATPAGTELLAVVDDAASAGPLHVGGAPLRALPLPFPVAGD